MRIPRIYLNRHGQYEVIYSKNAKKNHVCDCPFDEYGRYIVDLDCLDIIQVPDPSDDSLMINAASIDYDKLSQKIINRQIAIEAVEASEKAREDKRAKILDSASKLKTIFPDLNDEQIGVLKEVISETVGG